ncbi:RNA (guanine-9-)-methyltransferase domain-containing protein, partial [Thraustotheca clavata]
KKEEAQANKPKFPEPELDMSEAAVLMRKERGIIKRESFLMAANEGPTIVIDCGFEEKMNSREKKSLSQQIMFSYGINKRSDTPASVYLTSVRGETLANLNNIGGFNEWLAFASTAQCYMNKFRKESLVYLTADSPNVIEELSTDKVYIIGGIVDRNRLKRITYEKAVAQGIATAKLPLDKVVDMGEATRVLTVNHVFQILVNFRTVHDWTQATMSALPARKGVQVKAD